MPFFYDLLAKKSLRWILSECPSPTRNHIHIQTLKPIVDHALFAKTINQSTVQKWVYACDRHQSRSFVHVFVQSLRSETMLRKVRNVAEKAVRYVRHQQQDTKITLGNSVVYVCMCVCVCVWWRGRSQRQMKPSPQGRLAGTVSSGRGQRTENVFFLQYCCFFKRGR